MFNKIGVIGLGYVGLPLAVEFAKKYSVVGFDINEERIKHLQHGTDKTMEVSKDMLNNSNILFTSDANNLKNCNYIIVTVPTPITIEKLPNLEPLKKASELIGKSMSKGTIVIYESTVFPGVTEDECIPVLEKSSGFICGLDFFVGYSPERINPGDKSNKLTEIVKIVSGQNSEVLEKIAQLYETIIKAGVYRAPSIKVAEAAKVIENTQRDLNISLMNELAIIFERLEIDTTDVINAAGTKWNFLKFKPGLVGGHCIAVDPYYLTYKAERVGYIPEVILAGRRVNDNMGRFIASTIVKKLIKNNFTIQDSVITLLGITFKENVPDIRNSKVVDLISELKEFGFEVQVIDELANENEVLEEFNLELIDKERAKKADVVILAVPHMKYIEDGWSTINSLAKPSKNLVIDIKSALDTDNVPNNTLLWRL